MIAHPPAHPCTRFQEGKIGWDQEKSSTEEVRLDKMDIMLEGMGPGFWLLAFYIAWIKWHMQQWIHCPMKSIPANNS